MLEGYEPSELKELADESRDDDEARAIEAYRRQRIAEMELRQRQARFGRVYPIGRDDYTREVTEASKVDEEGEEMVGQGTGVVCFLYKDRCVVAFARFYLTHLTNLYSSQTASERTFSHIRTLAERHPRTKFVSIVGDKCIPNYPDKNLPTLFVYRKGEIVNQQVAWGMNQERKLEGSSFIGVSPFRQGLTHLTELEALLVLAGAIIPSDYIRTNRESQKASNRDGENSSDDDGLATRKTNGGTTKSKNIRGSARNDADDSGSDFDM